MTDLVTIDGEQYQVAHYYKIKLLQANRRLLFLDIAGRIASVGKQTQSDRILGYIYRLVDARKDHEDNIYVKIYNVQRQHENLVLADHVVLDGERRTKDYVKQILCSGQDGALVRQPVFLQKKQ